MLKLGTFSSMAPTRPLRSLLRGVRDHWFPPVLAALAFASVCPSAPAVAAPILRGEVSVASGVEAPPSATLYLTTRPNVADDGGHSQATRARSPVPSARPPSAHTHALSTPPPPAVPRAILSGTRGKAPPIAALRLAPPLRFPLQFELDDADLTPEGAAEPARWWGKGQLILSARLDSDGQAATREPTDLVGRAVCAPLRAGREGEGPAAQAVPRCSVQLVGRGIGGKLITSRK